MIEILEEGLRLAMHPFAFMLYGLLFHFATKVAGAKTHETDSDPCLTDYWRKHPLLSLLSLLGALIGYGLFAHYPEFDSMSPDVQNTARATAVGMGFMADRVVDALGGRARRKVEELP